MYVYLFGLTQKIYTNTFANIGSGASPDPVNYFVMISTFDISFVFIKTQLLRVAWRFVLGKYYFQTNQQLESITFIANIKTELH